MKRYLPLLLTIFCHCSCVFAQNSYFSRSRDQVKLYVNEYGSGKPVVLLAGGPVLDAIYLKEIWARVRGYRFIVPDQRCTGKSLLSKVDSITISLDGYVEDVETLRLHLGLNKIALVGHSWGGMLAMAYAAKYHDHIERLILIGPGGVNTDFAYARDNIQMRLQAEDIKRIQLADTTEINDFTGIWPGYFFSRERAMRGTVAEHIVGQRRNQVRNYLFKNYAATSSSRIAALARYQRPVYLIQGRQDPIDEATAYATKAALKQTQIVIIEKCGHYPWLENERTANDFFAALTNALPNCEQKANKYLKLIE